MSTATALPTCWSGHLTPTLMAPIPAAVRWCLARRTASPPLWSLPTWTARPDFRWKPARQTAPVEARRTPERAKLLVLTQRVGRHLRQGDEYCKDRKSVV